MDPRTTLLAFDAFLAERDLSFEGVVIGGTALALLGIISRPTKDCDVLTPSLPGVLREAVRDFARGLRARGVELADDWINNGPAMLEAQLPASWRDDLQPLFEGRALRLQTLGRLDLLRSKLFALCDRSIDLADCIAMRPTADELAVIRPWLAYQDANPQWPEYVDRVLEDLSQRLEREGGVNGI